MVYYTNYFITSDKVSEIQNIIQDPISIYEPVGEDKESVLGEFIESAVKPMVLTMGYKAQYCKRVGKPARSD